MHKKWSPQSRAERLVATGRLVLALSAFAAIYADPSEPAKFAVLTYGLLALYSIYSAVIVVLVHRAAVQWRIATHVVDLVLFTFLVSVTTGPSSPFFLFFIFSLLCATLRFHAMSVLYTAVAASAVYIASAVHAATFSSGFDWNLYLIRMTYLIVSAIFLFHLARYQEQLLLRWKGLAAWPRQVPMNLRPSLESMLVQCARLFASSNVEIVWEEQNEPFRNRAVLEGDSVKVETERSTDDDAPVLPEEHLLHCPFSGEMVHGYLNVETRERVVLEDVVLGDLAAQLIGSAIDHHYALQRVRHGTVLDERARLGRDLHDSLLQSLTGAGLQLESLHKLIERDPVLAHERIREVQRILAADRKELRSLVDRLQLRATSFRDIRVDLRLQELVTRFAAQWNLSVNLDIDPLINVTPASLQHEVYGLVAESVANAARHAGASRIDVVLDLLEDSVEITVIDNGHGFPFPGTYDLQELVEIRRGPVTLKERVLTLRGAMKLTTGDQGSTISIRVPLEDTANV